MRTKSIETNDYKDVTNYVVEDLVLKGYYNQLYVLQKTD